MRLLHAKDFTFKDFLGSDIPLYAIVSHRWSEAELSYQGFLKDKEEYIGGHLNNYAWTKTVKAAELALQFGVQWIWLDAICINKESSAELSEAINSMYDWYRYARFCFVFLPDVDQVEDATSETSSKKIFVAEADLNALLTLEADSHLYPNLEPVVYTPVRMYKDQFVQSAWFKRSWTLQELLAPGSVMFFNSKYEPLGSRHALAFLIKAATRIPLAFLRGGDRLRLPVTAACVAERMSWAAHRDATRTEDKAYSMLGLFQVNMPLLYGEGSRAFRRLQLEIIKESNDESILAWMSELVTIPGLPTTANSPVLSRSTNVFSYIRTTRCTFFQRKHYEVTNMGLRFTLPIGTNGTNEWLSRVDGVREALDSSRGSITLLFPLNCAGSWDDKDGKNIHGLLALLVMVDNQNSHRDLKILVGGRSRQLLISEDTTSDGTYDDAAGIPTANVQDRNAPISSRSWISVATGERQYFDLVVDIQGGSSVDEYSLYLKL